MPKLPFLEFAGNSGFSVCIDGKKLLVDFPYASAGHAFSPLRDEIATSEAFCHPSYLYYTHLHPDHFGAEEMLAFLRREGAERVFLPREGLKTSFIQKLQIQGEELFFLRSGKEERVEGEEFSMEIYPMDHMGEAYQSVRNFTLLLDVSGRRILITGDAKAKKECFAPLLNSAPIESAVINPLFLRSREGREILKTLGVRRILVCHIPFPEDDREGLGERTEKDAERYRREGFQIICLREALQKEALFLPESSV